MEGRETSYHNIVEFGEKKHTRQKVKKRKKSGGQKPGKGKEQRKSGRGGNRNNKAGH